MASLDYRITIPTRVSDTPRNKIIGLPSVPTGAGGAGVQGAVQSLRDANAIILAHLCTLGDTARQAGFAIIAVCDAVAQHAEAGRPDDD